MRINKIQHCYKNYNLYLQNDLQFVEVNILDKRLYTDNEHINISIITHILKQYIVVDNRYKQINRFLFNDYETFRLFILSFIINFRGTENNTSIIISYKKHIYFFRIDAENDLLMGEFRKFISNSIQFSNDGLNLYHITSLRGSYNIYDIFYNIMKYVNRNLF